MAPFDWYVLLYALLHRNADGMPWIRIQGLKKDDAGRISAGTATIVDTEYVQSTKGAKQHSKQITREKLGRPLALAADRRSGIFRSQEYGIVAYDADTDSKEVLEMDGPRLEEFIEAVSLDVHTVFGIKLPNQFPLEDFIAGSLS